MEVMEVVENIPQYELERDKQESTIVHSYETSDTMSEYESERKPKSVIHRNEAAETISEYELERGKPMPSMNHSIIQTGLIVMFYKYSAKFSILSELSLKLSDFQPTPDISIYPKLYPDWSHDIIKVTEPPLLVVEIMSPSQSVQEMLDKIEKYFQNGVQSCWLIHPALKTITLFTPDMKGRTYSAGTLKDHVTGIEVSVEEVFSSR
ncbi:MAG TPA: Uma2 family endonuclease [Thermodesulfovibrionia bacterium]|nr:Uma2 family endonuclease [Thermodesulfovibrionia bacterium]